MKTLYTNKRTVLVILGIGIGILCTIALTHDLQTSHLVDRKLTHLIDACRGYITDVVGRSMALM